MESTLEKLLRIQGKPEQLSMDTAPAPPDQHREGAAPPPAAAPAPAPPPDQRQEAAAAAQEAGPPPAQGSKTAPAIMEAWRGAFRAFAKYAQPLRLAAQRDDENEEAAALFMAAAEEVKAIYEAGGDAEIIALGVYGMLEDVFRREQQRRSLQNPSSGPEPGEIWAF